MPSVELPDLESAIGDTWSRRRSIQAPESFSASVEEQPLDIDRVHKYGPVTYYDGQVLLYDSRQICSLISLPSILKLALSSQRGDRMRKDLFALWMVAAIVFLLLLLLDYHIIKKDRWLEPGRALVTQTRSIVTFLMGFFLASALSRWWAIRNDCLGGLWGACDDLIMLLSAYFPSDTEGDRKIRELALRWCGLSFQLVFKQARETDADLDHLVLAGLLTENEKSALEGLPSKAQVVWAWMTSFCLHLACGEENQGGSCLPFPREILPQLHQICTKARGSIGETFAYTDTQIPLWYFAMLAHVTWVMNLFQAIYSGYAMNYFYQQEKVAYACCEIIFLIFYNSLFTTLLLVGESMLNPFRACYSEGFPGAAFGEFLRNECAAFQQANMAPPYGKPAIWSSSTACKKYWFGAK